MKVVDAANTDQSGWWVGYHKDMVESPDTLCARGETMDAISYPINLTAEEILGIYIADIHDAFEAKNPEAAFRAVDAKVQVTLDIEEMLPGMLPEGLFETLTENRITSKDFEARLRNPHF